MALLMLFVYGVALSTLAPKVAGEWTLVLTHTNELLYHLDELTDDYNECPGLVTTTTASSPGTTATTSPITSSPVTNATTATTPTTAVTTNATTASSTVETTAPTTVTQTTSSVTTATNSNVATTGGTSPSITDTGSTSTSFTTTAATTTTTATTTATATTATSNNATSATTNKITDSATTETIITSPVSSSVVTDATNPDGSSTATTPAAITTTSTPPVSSSTANTASTASTASIASTAARGRDSATCYGGVARHLSYVSRLKSQATNSTIFLNLNAGGMLGGSTWLPLIGSEPLVNATKMLQYDAIALGYRDFDEGVQVAANYINSLKSSNVTILCANVDVSNEPSLKDLLVPSLLLEPKPGFKVGIIGFIGKDADFLADTGKLVFSDESDAIRREASNLRNKGAKLTVALGSAGYQKGQEILRRTSEIDIMVNGGSNTFLHNGDSPSSEDKVVGDYPFVRETRGKKQLLVQVPRYGKYLGVLNAALDDDGRIRQVNDGSNTYRLENTPDETLKSYVKHWASEVSAMSSKKLGSTLVPLESGKDVCWKKECSAATLMTDAALWYLNLNSTAWSRSVSAVVWHGGALSDSEVEIGVGDVTLGDIVKIFPYANTLAVAEMKGSQVKTLFETAVESYGQPTSMGEFLHVAGARVQYDVSKDKGSRVQGILLRNPSADNADLRPLDDAVVYKIGMPSFIARGQMSYSFMLDVKHTDTGIRDEVVLEDYIKSVKILTVGNEGRVTFLTPVECWVDQTGTVFLTIFLTLLFGALIYLAYKYLYPRIATRRGSQSPLVRMGDLQGF